MVTGKAAMPLLEVVIILLEVVGVVLAPHIPPELAELAAVERERQQQRELLGLQTLGAAEVVVVYQGLRHMMAQQAAPAS
jgi:hypothetical protein